MTKQLTRVSKGMTEGRFGEVDVSRIDLDGVLELTVDDGQHITLTGHGAADFEITGFGDKLPIGYEFSVYIPRTIGDTGGTVNALGNYVQFMHSMTGDGFDLSINKRMDSGSALYTYQAYPNATDDYGYTAALHEKIMFVHEGEGRWRCTKLPESVNGSNEKGTFWRYADGMAYMNNRINRTLDSWIAAAANEPVVLNNNYLISSIGERYPAPLDTSNITQYGMSQGRLSTAAEFSYYITYSSTTTAWGISLINIGSTSAGGSGGTSIFAFVEVTGRWKPSV